MKRHFPKRISMIWIPIILSAGFIIGFLLRSALFDMHQNADVDYAAWTTLLLTLVTAITAGVIYWQGTQLKKQLELQTLTELYKEWNCKEMRKARCAACSVLPFDYSSDILNFDDKRLNKTEGVLEFLERIASYYKEKVLTIDLVWETIGFYIERYFHYTRVAIPEIRRRWKDVNLYEDIELLYKELMKMNIARRHTKGDSASTIETIEKQFDDEIDEFKKAECQWKVG